MLIHLHTYIEAFTLQWQSCGLAIKIVYGWCSHCFAVLFNNLQTSGMWLSCHCFKCQAYHFTETLLYFISQHSNHHVKTNQTEPKKKRTVGFKCHALKSQRVWIILLKNWTGKHCLCCIVTLQLY